MAGKNLWLGILVIVLVFGTTIIGCDNAATSVLKTDTISVSALNGTWAGIVGWWNASGVTAPFDPWASVGEFEFIDGYFEYFDYEDDINYYDNYCKGTYAINNSKINFEVTSIFSDGDGYLDLKWYSKNEFETALKASGYFSDEYIADLVNNEFWLNGYGYGGTLTYNGNDTLTIKTEYYNDLGKKDTYTLTLTRISE